MANLKQMMLEEVKKNTLVQTSFVNVTEELIDTGLEKNEENLKAAALNYLEEKGYRKRADNVEMAKQMIMESSEGYDTIIVKQKRVTETDLFENAKASELRDALDICTLETLSVIDSKLERLADKHYEYKVHALDAVRDESERPKKGGLANEFVSLEEVLNNYSKLGWELDQMYPEPKTSNNMNPRTFLVFKREKMN